jgi:ATP-dependent protease ClpP protease subunit
MSSNNANKLDKSKFNFENAIEYGIDFENRVIRISGSIGAPDNALDCNYFDFNLFDTALTAMERESHDPVTIKINSPGGELYEAFAIAGRIKESSCIILTEGFGKVMSAATIILMAGEDISISRYCTTMFHELGYGVSGQHENNKDYIKQAEKELKFIAKYYADHSNKESSFWLRKIRKKEYYPTVQELEEFGVVHHII